TAGGGAVFSTGSITFCGSLSHNNYDNHVSRMLQNVLRRVTTVEPSKDFGPAEFALVSADFVTSRSTLARSQISGFCLPSHRVILDRMPNGREAGAEPQGGRIDGCPQRRRP